MGEPKAGTDKENVEDAASDGSAQQQTFDGEQISLGDRRIEIDFLAYETCCRIAEYIANECSAFAKQGAILVGPAGVANVMFQARALASSLDALLTQIVAAADAAERAAAAISAATTAGDNPQHGDALEGARGSAQAGLETAAKSFAASMASLGPVTATAAVVLDNAVKIAKSLAIFETHVARETTISDDLAATVVAAALRKCGGNPRLVSSFSSLGAGKHLQILDDLAKATARLRAVAGFQSEPDAIQLLARVDQLLSGAEAAQSALWPLSLLQMLDDGGGHLLAVKTATAGGAYRVRRSLLSWLGFKDPLSASGGAALAWALTSLATGEIVAGDLSFDISAPVQWPRKPDRRSIGNLRAAAVEQIHPPAQTPSLPASGATKVNTLA